MKALFTVLLLLSGSVLCRAAPEEKAAGPAFQVHGRLSLYNGNPGFRIWIVGTKRILGVAEFPPETPLMPSKLRELALGEQFVFADFTVLPLTKEEEGVMRTVRVIRAERTVITDGSLKFIRRINERIEEEPIQPTETTRGK